jgi:hypothetical protein
MRILKLLLKQGRRHGSADVAWLARTSFICVRMCALVALLFSGSVRVEAQPALPSVPGMGLYSNIGSLICGRDGVGGDRWNSPTIPFIGCLGLSRGGNASGVISGHQFEITVDVQGQEHCKRDGAEIRCFGCMDEDAACSTMIDVLSRNSDGSVFFSISRTIVNNNYVTTQENWDEAQKPTSWMRRR